MGSSQTRHMVQFVMAAKQQAQDTMASLNITHLGEVTRLKTQSASTQSAIEASPVPIHSTVR